MRSLFCGGCSAPFAGLGQWRNKRGARGDICPRAQHFGGAKLRSEC